MDLKSQVGKKAGPARLRVSREKIAAFAAAVGAKDREAAPPTLMTICRAAEFELFEKLEIPLSAVLHAEQLYTYAEPIVAGDELVYETELSSALEKSGASGRMAFLTFDTKIGLVRAGRKLEAGGARTTIVVREGR